MIPDSSAGTDSEPVRYRWVTRPLPSGRGDVTAVSVVPKAAVMAAIIPLTLRRRDAGLELGHGEPVPAEHVGDLGDVGRVGSVPLPELLRG